MPFLLSACDVYAAPSRLEGFGMGQIEAGACGKPVIGIRAMAMLETLVHGQTALLAGVATENIATGCVVGPEAGFAPEHRIEFASPRIVDYRASVPELAQHLRTFAERPRAVPKNGRGRARARARVRLPQGRPAFHRHRAAQTRPGWAMSHALRLSVAVEAARRAAVAVLEHNAVGPFAGLPRTAGFGYPEPYTRDLMISLPRVSAHRQLELREQMRKTLLPWPQIRRPEGTFRRSPTTRTIWARATPLRSSYSA